MDEKGRDIEELSLRVEQLQRERDKLRKDIEQLCMQQAGPSYASVATQMHFQRTTALEQEIEILQKKLAGCLREKRNLQEELEEAYRIKTQLADLHSAELIKNKEAEKQVKFFQSCVAAAFAERDQSLMECEKAKEREETVSNKLIDLEKRIDELQTSCLEQKRLNDTLSFELKQLKDSSESFVNVITKFCEIRKRDAEFSQDNNSLEEKCMLLLNDCSDNWIFTQDGETSTSKYIASLEEEREALKRSIDNLQSNLRMGLEIEHHLRRNVRSLERKQRMLNDLIGNSLANLRDFCTNQRVEIVKILEEEESHIKSVVSQIQEQLNQVNKNPDNENSSSDIIGEREEQNEEKNDCTEFKDVHVSIDASSSDIAQSSNLITSITPGNADVSKALAQALQEKVSALLLLSQQEERHLLERNMNEALLRKIDELQKSLSQVTNEKVKALMEMAKLKQEYQLLKDGDRAKRSTNAHDGEGKIKSILKRTYLNRWISSNVHVQDESGIIHEKEYSVDLARLRVENATLHESMANMEHLTSSIHRLHVTLMKAQDDTKSDVSRESIYESLSSVITEASLTKTALSTVLPVNWAGDSSDHTITYESLYEPSDASGGEEEASRQDRGTDPLSSAGLEMVELLILAAELLKESLIGRNVGI